MQKLTSYAAGSWHEGTGEGVQIHNPTSGEAIALVDSTGLDFQAIFLALKTYFDRYGSVYKMCFGPKSFMVVNDPVIPNPEPSP